MSKIWLVSDWHFCHNREFVYKPRGFNTIQEMNEAIVKRHNEVVNMEDDVYVLGDLMLNDNNEGIKLIKQLKGKLHVILGNHCTDARVELYKNCDNIVDISYATMIKYNGYRFYLSHYPTMTGNLEKESLKQVTCNLFGHTHQKTNFYNDIPFMYHVGVDSHNCTPVLLDDIIEEMNEKVKECKDML